MSNTHIKCCSCQFFNLTQLRLGCVSMHPAAIIPIRPEGHHQMLHGGEEAASDWKLTTGSLPKLGTHVQHVAWKHMRAGQERAGPT